MHSFQVSSLPKYVAALEGLNRGTHRIDKHCRYRQHSVGIDLTSAFSAAISLSFAIKLIKHSSTLTIPDHVQGRGNGSGGKGETGERIRGGGWKVRTRCRLAVVSKPIEP